MKKGVKIALVLMVCLAVFDLFGQGCSQCKMMAEQSTVGEDSFGSNINTGILYLMAIPYVLLLVLFRKKIVTVLKMLTKK